MDRETERDARFELKLDAGRPLPDAIADRVRALVESNEFRPGNRLPTESELARSMRVARSSVRTALQRLETLGVLEVKRGLGWYVRRAPTPGSSSVDLFAGKKHRPSDLFEVRIGLEGLGASLAAVRATEGEVEDIAKLNALHAEAGDDCAELLRTDIAFHEAVMRASGNVLLFETYQQVVGELTEWRYQSFAERGVPLRSAREHGKVVRYLRNQDPGGARAAMYGHLQRVYDSLPEIEGEPLDLTDSGSEAEPDWHAG